MNDESTHRREGKELVFVYNARSDIFSKVTDFAHKIISPESYPCILCSLTHGALEMRREWAEFIQSLPLKVSFLYKDQVESHSWEDVPQVWIQSGRNRELLISAGELNAIPTLEALMDLVNQRLNDWRTNNVSP
jgi:hypothetical protein